METSPFTTTVPTPLQDQWGFVGTLRLGVVRVSEDERQRLHDDQLEQVWAVAVVAMMREYAVDEEQAAEFLRSRWGRHLADEVTNQYDGDLMDAVLLAVGRRSPNGQGWWEMVSNRALWAPFTFGARRPARWFALA